MIDKGTSETPFDNYMPIFDTIQIVNDKKTAKDFEARYPLEIWPPGYSNDGTVCVPLPLVPRFQAPFRWRLHLTIRRRHLEDRSASLHDVCLALIGNPTR